MKKHGVGIFLFLVCVTFGANGCAKHEMVKAEEPLAPSTAVTKPPVKSEAAPVKPATSAPVKVEPAPVKVEPVQPVTPPPIEPVSHAGELKASLDKIYFDFDSSTLSKEARGRLTKDADLMKKDPDVRVQIEGHCDERGSDEYNLALGEKRAMAAKNYLTALGIPADRLSVISYGKEKPADPGHNAAAWAKNRRDEFVVPNK